MEKVLVVEDEKDIRETLEDILNLAGYEVLTACNGKEGYDFIINNNPDLVLCDVNMPVLDGFELLGAVNQRLRDKPVPPFLFLTAKVEKEDMRYGMSLGADDYILKPYDPIEILKTVKLRIDKRKQLLKSNNKPNDKAPMKRFDKLVLPCEDGLELIGFDRIIKCQADRSYCHFYLVENKKIIVSKPMKEFEEILTSRNFIKIHKSTIVNIQHIEKFVRGKSGYLMMSDGTTASVSVRKKEELIKLLKSSAY